MSLIKGVRQVYQVILGVWGLNIIDSSLRHRSEESAFIVNLAVAHVAFGRSKKTARSPLSLGIVKIQTKSVKST